MKRTDLDKSCRCNARARSKAVPLKVNGITVVLLFLVLTETIAATKANATVAASLKFKSSYDAPVFLSGTPVTKIHGTDQGYSWDDVKTWWSLEGIAVSVNCAFIDSIPSADPLGPQTAHTGSASSKTLYINFPSFSSGVCREELIMFFADEAPSGKEIGYMKKFYMSQWYFLPINFSMNLLRGGQIGY